MVALTGGRPRLSPLMRRLAAEHSLSLAAITGTGSDGRIRKQDVLEAARAQRAAAQAGRAERYPAALAERYPAALAWRYPAARESLQASAQLTTVVEADVTRIARLRDRARDAFEARGHRGPLNALPRPDLRPSPHRRRRRRPLPHHREGAP
ncbi:MAG TPA: E3 binding domain-containing protein [Trebonia sp.]